MHNQSLISCLYFVGYSETIREHACWTNSMDSDLNTSDWSLGSCTPQTCLWLATVLNPVVNRNHWCASHKGTLKSRRISAGTVSFLKCINFWHTRRHISKHLLSGSPLPQLIPQTVQDQSTSRILGTLDHQRQVQTPPLFLQEPQIPTHLWHVLLHKIKSCY